MDFRVDPRTVFSNATPSSVREVKSKRLEKLRKSVEELEVTFVNEMMKAMRKNIPEGELFKKNSAEKMFEEMQDTELTRAMCRGQNFGLADAMYRQMAPLVEQRAHNNEETNVSLKKTSR